MTFPRFLALFLGFNLALAFFPWLMEYQLGQTFLIPKFWKLFIIFDLFTFIVFCMARWRMAVSDKASGQVILGTVTIRFLFCMILVLFYLTQNTVIPLHFIACFFYLYFFHSLFEIYCMLCNLRNQKIK